MEDEVEHRGLLVPHYADGEVVGELPGGAGHLVRLPAAGRPSYVTRSVGEATGWRCRCSCGRWQSEPFQREADATATWSHEHLPMLRAVAVVRDARHNVETALRALDEAVAGARQAGATWEAIGAAAGITRQSAHARWGRLTSPGPLR